MIIITRNNKAVMYYSESQWLDAVDASFGDNVSIYRVPNSSASLNILGTIGESEEIDYETNQVIKAAIEATPAMTEEQVQAIATETLS